MVKIIEKRHRVREIPTTKVVVIPKTITNSPEVNKQEEVKFEKKKLSTSKNKVAKNKEEMNRNDLEKANNIVNSMNSTEQVKRIKTDNSLIERVELNKVVLTEDNKMLLND